MTAGAHLLAAVLAGVVGLAMGSFAGVVVDRVPHSRSILAPASHCDACSVPLRALDNVPVFSYLALRGRCRSCRAPIPVRALVVEVLTAALFVLLAFRVQPLWALPAYLAAATGLVALSLVDLELHRLPTPIVYWTAATSGLLLVLASAATGRWVALVHALIGAGVCFAAFFAIFFAAPKGMGFGDVRLAALCGGCLGWLGIGLVPLGILASFILAGVPAVALLALGRATRKSQLPFGPYLAAGTLVAVSFGPALLHVAGSLP